MAIKSYADLEKARVVLGRPGLAGTGINAAQLGDLTSRIGAMEGHTIADHPDTDIDNPTEGQILRYDANGKLVNVTPGGGVRVRDHTAAIISENAGDLTYRKGLTAVDMDLGGRVALEPRYGTDAETVAEGNHTHSLPVKTRHANPDPGAIATISSGSRNLVSATVGSFEIGVPTLVEVDVFLHAEGVNDPALFSLEIEIDGTTASTDIIPSTQRPTFEWGVNGEWTFTSWRTITRASGQSATRDVIFRLVWRSGGGVSVKAAWMDIKRTAAR